MQNKKPQAVTKVEGYMTRSSLKQEPWTPEDRASLAIVLGHVFDMQKQFGKNLGQLENIVKGFCWVLRPYPLEAVVDAIATYCRYNADMPTPSDIVKIIDPPKPVWKPDWSYAATLRKIKQEQGPYALNDEEIAYLAKCDDLAQDQAKADDRPKE